MTATTPQSTASGTASPRSRTKGELIVDVLLVVGIAYYLWVAHSYPPDGREIPTVVGIVALVAAVVQLIGWFVPGMWNFTHGQARSGHAETAAAVAAPPQVAEAAVAGTAVSLPAATAVAADAAIPDPGIPDAAAGTDTTRRAIDVPVVMAWAAGFVAAILVLGYDIAVPLFFLAYFGSRRQWKLALAAAVVMGLITHFLFETALGIQLPGGLFF